MSAEHLWETTMNPDTRRLLPIRLGDPAVEGTTNTLTMLMGRGEAAQRRTLLEERGNEVEADI
jgi:topoisomerase-4 subunit B